MCSLLRQSAYIAILLGPLLLGPRCIAPAAPGIVAVLVKFFLTFTKKEVFQICLWTYLLIYNIQLFLQKGNET